MSISRAGRLSMRLAMMLGACVAGSSASPAAADQLYYEPFLTGSNPAAGQYTVGVLDPSDATGDGQNPTVGPTSFLAGSWVRQTDAPNGAVQATGLSYLGAPSAGGSQSTIPNSRQRRFLPAPWTSTTTGTYYLSFAINFGQGNYADGIEGNDMGYRAAEFWLDTGGFAMGVTYNSFGSRIGPAQQDPRTGRMFADFSGLGGGDVIIENAPLSFMEDGAIHLVVLRFNLSDQAASDSVLLYLDPTSVTEPDLPGASMSGIDFTLGALGGVTIFGGSGTFPVYDELRVATTFLEAVPPLPLPGDTNGDGFVDMTDYIAITTHLNLTGQTAATGDVAGADGKQGSDGRVDLRDLQLWRTHRTDISPGAAGGLGSESLANGGVPEPGTAMLLAIGAGMLASQRTRRRCDGAFDQPLPIRIPAAAQQKNPAVRRLGLTPGRSFQFGKLLRQGRGRGCHGSAGWAVEGREQRSEQA